MGNITMEDAIALRDTIAEPYYIVNNILYNEGMELYIEAACGRILELADSDPEYQKEIYLNIMDFNIEVTLVGFLLVKSILLSYISEEKYQEYLQFLRLKNEQVRTWNGMIVFLRELSKKKLCKLRKDIRASMIEEDKERMLTLVQCELKARSFLSRMKTWLINLKSRALFNLRALKIVHFMKRETVYKRQ